MTGPAAHASSGCRKNPDYAGYKRAAARSNSLLGTADRGAIQA
jgi:hypothetical protein